MQIKLRESSSSEEVEKYYDYLSDSDSEDEDIDITESLMEEFPDLTFFIKDDFDTEIRELSKEYSNVGISSIKSIFENTIIYVGQVGGDSLYYFSEVIINEIKSQLHEITTEIEEEHKRNYEILKSLVKELVDTLEKNEIEYFVNESLSTYSFYVSIYPDDKDSIKVRFSDHQESVDRDRKADFSIEISKLDYDWGKSKFKQFPSEGTLEDVYHYLGIN